MTATVVVVAGSFLSLYAGRTDGAPAGRDTSFYVWRAKLVVSEGLGALPGSIAPPFRAQAYRAGHPVLAAFLDPLAGVDPVTWAFVLPAVMAGVAAAGAGAFALRGLREPWWAFPIYAVALGTSLNITQISMGRADNLIVDALVVAAATIALMAAAGDRTIWAGILLLAAAIVTHWFLVMVFVAVLAVLALLLLPGSLRKARTEGLASTPSGRLGLLLGGTAIASAAALAAAPGRPELPSEGWIPRVANKLEDQGPRFALTAAAAAPGGAALLVPRSEERRRGLLLTLVWAGPAVAGLMALVPGVFPTVPAHRIVPLALGLPLLGAAAVAALARLLARIRPAPLGQVAAALAVATTLVAATVWARGVWMPAPKGQAEIEHQAATAGRYLTAVGGDAPVIFLSQRPRRRDPGRTVRAALPADVIPRAYVHLGDLDDLRAAEQPRPTGDPAYEDQIERHWAAVRPLLDDDPIVIALSSLIRGPFEVSGIPLGPGVVLVRGPEPPVAIEPAPAPSTPSQARLAGAAAAALALFLLVGIGWSCSLVPSGWLERIALAPALGIAVLVIGGVVAARAGIDGPAVRPGLAVAVALLGWAPTATRLHAGRGRQRAEGRARRSRAALRRNRLVGSKVSAGGPAATDVARARRGR